MRSKPTAPPAAPPTACCGLVVPTPESHLQASATEKNTQKHNAATRATVAISVRRFPQLPTSTQRAQSKLPRVQWMRRSTVSSDAPAVRNMRLTSLIGSNLLARTNQRWCHPLGKKTVHFPHHLGFFALPSAGARRQARTRAILCGLVATKPSTSITPSRPTRLSTRWSQKHQHTDNDDIYIKFADMSPANRKASSLCDFVATTVHVTKSRR